MSHIHWRPWFLRNQDKNVHFLRRSSNNYFCKIIIQGTLLPVYNEIHTVLSDKKIFKDFIIYIGENKPRPMAAMFLTNHDKNSNFVKGSPNNYFCKIILKSS